jgi:prepilin-type N-terminal cleavage/methylation domain-containing protein
MSKVKTKANNLKAGKTSGFTLMELTVALGIFAVVMVISAGILLNSLKTARYVANQARAVDNISLAMEQMVREIRTGSNISFLTDGFAKQVSFTNYEGENTTYSFCGTRMCRNGTPITTENTIITGGFIITDFGDTKTPRITVAAKATDTKGNVLGSIQTAVSARLINYKEL